MIEIIQIIIEKLVIPVLIILMIVSVKRLIDLLFSRIENLEQQIDRLSQKMDFSHHDIISIGDTLREDRKKQEKN